MAERSLEATEKAFDFVAQPVHFLVEFLRDLAVGLGRDYVNRALFPNHIADPIGIVCLVGQHPLAWLQPSWQRLTYWRVMGLTRGASG